MATEVAMVNDSPRRANNQSCAIGGGQSKQQNLYKKGPIIPTGPTSLHNN